MKFLVGHQGRKRDAEFLPLLNKLLNAGDSDVTYATNWISLLDYAVLDRYSAIWLDWHVVEDVYPEFHKRLSKVNPQTPVIVLCDPTSIDGRLLSATDLLFSVLSREQIAEEGENILVRLRRYEDLLTQLPKDTRDQLRANGFGPLVGNSLTMLEIYRNIARVAQTDFTALILGQSGSGKEIVARAVHDLSSRRNHTFFSINCAAIPENLLESELFGYEKGAFTGADHPRVGKFEMSDKSTIFLDEIGDMPLSLQAKLLRVLEDHTVERLGGTTSRKVDIRVLAATNQDLSALIEKGEFRADLHYRLDVIPIELPSLAQKPEDILLLTLHILGTLIPGSKKDSIQSLSWGFVDLLQSTDLSGNVRELENILTRVLFYSDSPDLTEHDLRTVMARVPWREKREESKKEEPVTFNNRVEPLRKIEELAIRHSLSKSNGNISEAALKLGISRTTLYRKLRKYGVEAET